MLFLIAPSLFVVPLSFSDSRYLTFPPPAWSTRWYEAYFSAIEWREATYVSFAAAILTMLLSTTLGTLAAYGLHALRSRWSALAYGAFTLPLVIPAILIAIGIFLFYAQLGLNNTLTGIVLAHSVLADPAGRDYGRLEPQELRHEPGDGRAQPGRQPAAGPFSR